jgi:hypothetical protein
VLCCSRFRRWVYRAVYLLRVAAVVVGTTMRAVLVVALSVAKVETTVALRGIVRGLVVRKLMATHLALVVQLVVRIRAVAVVVIGVAGVRGKHRS